MTERRSKMTWPSPPFGLWPWRWHKCGSPLGVYIIFCLMAKTSSSTTAPTEDNGPNSPASWADDLHGLFPSENFFPPSPPQVVDLLSLLKNVTTQGLEGLSFHPGPHSSSPAVFFPGSHPPQAFALVPQLRVMLESFRREFALLASIKQKERNVGTILLITTAMAEGQGRGHQHHKRERKLLEVQSSGRQGQLRLLYHHGHLGDGLESHSQANPSVNGTPPINSSSSMHLAVETIPLQLADDQWHKLAMVVSGNQLQIFLDCQLVYQSVIYPLDFRIPQGQNLTLYIGQQQSHNFLYQGFIQNLHLVAGRHGQDVQCPRASVYLPPPPNGLSPSVSGSPVMASPGPSCPTCGEFQSLEEQVHTLTAALAKQLVDLKNRLAQAENRLSQVEDCDCPKSCRAPGGIVREDGASWSEGCQLCSCVKGEILCREPICPTLNCTDPDPADPTQAQCCPTCKAECRHFGNTITHGSLYQPRPCVTCECDDGWLSCKRQDQIKCPKLECPEDEQILEEGKCCKVCTADHCGRGHDCHPSAKCVNGHFNYTCQCPEGFTGDGRTKCEDIDECQALASTHGNGSTLQLHHCTMDHGRCVNTPGTYACDCMSGFEKQPSIDSIGVDFHCVPINACLALKNTQTGQIASGEQFSPCHRNATCQPTGPAQYVCECDPGFQGDGTDCQPRCEDPCENGGLCVAPGICYCLPSFTGAQCQADVNECTEERDPCGPNAACINHLGGFTCQCQVGFVPYQHPDRDGHLECVDLDECEMDTHTCEPTSKCLNTLGSYQCICPAGGEPSCLGDCWEGTQLRANNSKWMETECSECECHSGQVTCHPLPCDCIAQGGAMSNPTCCPQCPGLSQCHVQNSASEWTTFQSGDHWTQDHLLCECIDGQVDCWAQSCFPLLGRVPQLLGNGGSNHLQTTTSPPSPQSVVTGALQGLLGALGRSFASCASGCGGALVIDCHAGNGPSDSRKRMILQGPACEERLGRHPSRSWTTLALSSRSPTQGVEQPLAPHCWFEGQTRGQGTAWTTPNCSLCRCQILASSCCLKIDCDPTNGAVFCSTSSPCLNESPTQGDGVEGEAGKQ